MTRPTAENAAEDLTESSAGTPTGTPAEIAAEQEYVTMLYGRVDRMRSAAKHRLDRALRDNGGGTMQARSERDTRVAYHGDQIALLDGVENGLCFGRLDREDDSISYIGRIGLFSRPGDSEGASRRCAEEAERATAPGSRAGDYEPLLLDWRAPAARPFYLATAAAPEGVRRRRHIRTRQRQVVDLDDEVLDLREAAAEAEGSDLTSEAALLAAMGAHRTGRMRDIVETIQIEQDRVIRSDLNATLVVQGGPGTGKTAVALHRAAYLLYTYREQLSKRAVLVVGPNETFLRYISQVLPSLAETGVLLGTVGDLFPGVRARRAESREAAEVKGRAVMAQVIANAVHDRQLVPDESIYVEVDRETLRIEPGVVKYARTLARRSGRPHNLSRDIFVRRIVDALGRQLAEAIGSDPYADDSLGGTDAPGEPILLGEADLADIRAEIEVSPAVRAQLDLLWPTLTPQQLIVDLFADAGRIATAAPMLTPRERRLLFRPFRGRGDAPGQRWSPADVPLLDEAAELLGEDETVARQRARRLRRRRVEYAQGALDIAEGSRTFEWEDVESEVLTAADIIDAARLAERHEDGEHLSAAQRAAADRCWAFGHIVVDEAQELSPMAWRMLMRRSPSRSMTIVGDVAQTGTPGGAAAWGEVLEPYLADRWRQADLSVNYRTPSEIMDLAARVLATANPLARAPMSVRSTGERPWVSRAEPGGLGTAVARAAQVAAERVGAGRVGVIVPASRLDELAESVARVVPDVSVGDDPRLTSRVVLLTVTQAKGLEFDAVVLAEPGQIVSESSHGYNDLYVALTRATRSLGIVHEADLPAALT